MNQFAAVSVTCQIAAFRTALTAADTMKEISCTAIVPGGDEAPQPSHAHTPKCTVAVLIYACRDFHT